MTMIQERNKTNKFPLSDLLKLHFIPAIGPYRAYKLIQAFKNSERMYSAPVNDLIRVEGFSEKLAKYFLKSVRDPELAKQVDGQLGKLKKHSASVVTIWDEAYPKNLLNIYSPPLVLFMKGNIRPEDERSIAVVGSRTVSEYGRCAAEKIAGDLAAQGITVVSGMATGIDTEAHWASLKSGGRTIAILGCGIDVVYPASNNSLYKEIINNGAVISEFPFGTKLWPGNFPQRNRIISGISLGTLVVEAGKKSGALITASAALEQNREVFAVPGNISSRYSNGSNALIRDGAAKLVQNAEDIINELRPALGITSGIVEEITAPPVNLSHEESVLYEYVGSEPIQIDKITQNSKLSTAKVLAILLTLELKGLIRKLPGSKFIRL